LKTYLVTGGAGFIGSNIVRALLERGDRVRILDNLITGRSTNVVDLLEHVELLEGDLRDAELVRDAVRGVDAVIHQAASLR
jgi:UDP-glucose 4-epimerase